MIYDAKINQYLNKIEDCRRVLDRISLKLARGEFKHHLQFSNLDKALRSITQCIPKPKIIIIDDYNPIVLQKSKDHVISSDSDSSSQIQQSLTYGKLKEFKFIPLNNELEDQKQAQCILCKNNSYQKFGPLLRMKTYRSIPPSVPMHQQCALWTNELYFFEDEENESLDPNNIFEQIQKALKTKCHLCSESGASLRCAVKECSNSFHFPCFFTLLNYGSFISKSFTIYCDKHKQNKKQKTKAKQKKKMKTMQKKNSNTYSQNELDLSYHHQMRELLNRHPIQKQENEKDSWDRKCIIEPPQWKQEPLNDLELQRFLQQFNSNYLSQYEQSREKIIFTLQGKQE